jgi:hypothetical protein
MLAGGLAFLPKSGKATYIRDADVSVRVDNALSAGPLHWETHARK